MSASSRRRTRWRRVMERDGWKCAYCGSDLDEENGTVDHVVPRSRGGRDAWANLRAACKPCNIRKADKLPSEFAPHVDLSGVPSPGNPRQRRKNKKPARPPWFGVTVASPALLAKMREHAAEDYASYQAAQTAAAYQCGLTRYLYRHQAERMARRPQPRGGAVQHCSRCLGFHVLRTQASA